MTTYLLGTGANTSVLTSFSSHKFGKWTVSWCPPASHHISRHVSPYQCHSQEPRQGVQSPLNYCAPSNTTPASCPAAELKQCGLSFPGISQGGWMLPNPNRGMQVRPAAWTEAALWFMLWSSREININYSHKCPWKNIISVKHPQRHKQHNALALQ